MQRGDIRGWMANELPGAQPVSYTHLDVYKRQRYSSSMAVSIQRDTVRVLLPRPNGSLPVSYTHLLSFWKRDMPRKYVQELLHDAKNTLYYL